MEQVFEHKVEVGIPKKDQNKLLTSNAVHFYIPTLMCNWTMSSIVPVDEQQVQPVYTSFWCKCRHESEVGM